MARIFRHVPISPALRVSVPLLCVLPLAAPPLAAQEAREAQESREPREATIRVHADQVLGDVSRFLTGACIEDVNHEIYGGIYSQMVFGESFQEPAVSLIEGFAAHGGDWRVVEGALQAPAGDGPKLVAAGVNVAEGEATVEVRFDDATPGLAGLILKVREAATGADRWIGYEVSLDPSRQVLVLGRHRHNWEPLGESPCAVPVGEWIPLSVRMEGAALEVRVGDHVVRRYEDRERPLPAGAVGLRTWRRQAAFRALVVSRGEAGAPTPLPFQAADPRGLGGVSGQWRPVRKGPVEGGFDLVREEPFVGTQSQRIELVSGEGELGIENRGLNRQGMAFEAERPYEGYLWLRAERPVQVLVAAESANGAQRHAATTLEVSGPWRRYDFELRPRAAEREGRLTIALASRGAVTIGHAFLQPGAWGRFQGLPARRDVVEGLQQGGITVMRLGGLMANAEGYRWKSMIGPRDRRQPYRGYWYPYSTNGWGILDFLDTCEAAGFLPVVAVNLDEAPGDLADLVEYCNGPVESAWGGRRARDGHPKPYGLEHLELGNEEAVDADYWRRFEPIAEAVWARDPDIVLVIADFEYKLPIKDPNHVEGAPRIQSLAAHKEILDLARARGREVWFDVHIWNDSPGVAKGSIEALPTFADALERLSPGARFRVCVLEENSVNHSMRRALAHAETIHGLMRLGDRVPVVCAANALQPHGQNDNGWDQGLLFLDPSRVWGQPPYHITRMFSESWLPRRVAVEVEGGAGNRGGGGGGEPAGCLDAVAMASDGALSVLVVNTGSEKVRSLVVVQGMEGSVGEVLVTQMAGGLEEVNSPREPDRVVPWQRTARVRGGKLELTLPPWSYTSVRTPPE